MWWASDDYRLGLIQLPTPTSFATSRPCERQLGSGLAAIDPIAAIKLTSISVGRSTPNNLGCAQATYSLLGGLFVKRYLLAAAALTGSAPAEAQILLPAQNIPPALQAHLDGDQVVTLSDGRRIQLVCMGEGSPTVILAAGAGAPSVYWFGIQPVLAERTRVCSWSRAGFGLSGPSPFPQSVDNRTDDLEAALAARNIAGPFIMVGASLGAYEALLFADRHPDDTAGLVLIDPAIPEQVSRRDRVAPGFSALAHMNTRARVLTLIRCAVGVRAGTSASGKPDPEGCLRPIMPPTAPEIIRRAFPAAAPDAAIFETQASLWSAADIDGVLVGSASRNYGDMPIVVLSAGDMDTLTPQAPPVVREQYPASYSDILEGHAELAGLSSRGLQRTVTGSTHDIAVLQPAAVIAAIIEVIDQAR